MTSVTVNPPAPASARLRRLGSGILGSPVLRVVARRLALMVPLLFFVSALSFILVSVAPGDPAQQILGVQATPEAYENLRRLLGLDEPLYTQYWDWVKNALHGDFGTSLLTGEAVSDAISSRLPVTLSLMLGALLVSVVIGLPLGIASALRGGVLGRAISAVSLVGFALPSFWIAAILASVFAVKLGWFPASGYVPFEESPSEWFNSLVLPVIALSLGSLAAIAKQTRASMLDVLGSEHVRLAWANGLSARSIYFRHSLKNAAPPVLTVAGVHAVWLVGGTVLVETVFALPGLGSLVVNASLQGDLPVVEGVAICFTLMVVVITLLIDLAYAWLHPRARTV